MSIASRTTFAAVAGLACITSAAVVIAAWTSSYANSTTTIAGTTAPYVEWVAGADSGASDHVAGFTIGTNRTSFSTTLKGYAGTTTVITDLVKLRNVHTDPHAVTLTGTQVTNPKVTNASLEVFNGATSKGYLDLKSPTPSLTLGSVPAGTTYTTRATYTFILGAGANDATIALTVKMWVTP